MKIRIFMHHCFKDLSSLLARLRSLLVVILPRDLNRNLEFIRRRDDEDNTYGNTYSLQPARN